MTGQADSYRIRNGRSDDLPILLTFELIPSNMVGQIFGRAALLGRKAACWVYLVLGSVSY